MMKRPNLLIVFLITFLVSLSESAKILGLFTSFSRSHLIIHKSVIQTLIDRGHNVTIVTTLPLEDSNQNYRHIQLDVPPFPYDFILNAAAKSTSPFSVIHSLVHNMDLIMNYSQNAITHRKMKQLMVEETFDLAIIGFFFYIFEFGVAAHFKCPIVVSLTLKPFSLINSMIGNPHEVLYIPPMILGTSPPTNFVGRLNNVFGNVVESMFFSFVEYKAEQYYKANFPPEKYPPLKELYKNISLVLVTSYFSHGAIRPNVPALVQIEGIQIKPTSDPLPQLLITVYLEETLIAVFHLHAKSYVSAFLSTNFGPPRPN